MLGPVPARRIVAAACTTAASALLLLAPPWPIVALTGVLVVVALVLAWTDPAIQAALRPDGVPYEDRQW